MSSEGEDGRADCRGRLRLPRNDDLMMGAFEFRTCESGGMGVVRKRCESGGKTKSVKGMVHPYAQVGIYNYRFSLTAYTSPYSSPYSFTELTRMGYNALRCDNHPSLDHT